MVEVGGWVLPQIFPQPFHTFQGRFIPGITLWSLADPHGCENSAIVFIQFLGRQIMLVPIPGTIGPLKGPHAVQGLPCDRTQPAASRAIMECESDGRGHYLCGCLILLGGKTFSRPPPVPTGHAFFYETLDSGQSRRLEIAKHSPGHYLGITGMTTGAILTAQPGDSRPVDVFRPLGHGNGFCQGLVCPGFFRWGKLICHRSSRACPSNRCPGYSGNQNGQAEKMESR